MYKSCASWSESKYNKISPLSNNIAIIQAKKKLLSQVVLIRVIYELKKVTLIIPYKLVQNPNLITIELFYHYSIGSVYLLEYPIRNGNNLPSWRHCFKSYLSVTALASSSTFQPKTQFLYFHYKINKNCQSMTTVDFTSCMSAVKGWFGLIGTKWISLVGLGPRANSAVFPC